jgi:hypothetical protein
MNETKQRPECRDRIGSYQPENGVVATDQIAREVGYYYLNDVYPQDQLRPLSAVLDSGVWKVSGNHPKGTPGGAAHILICQSNGRVLRMWHDK